MPIIIGIRHFRLNYAGEIVSAVGSTMFNVELLAGLKRPIIVLRPEDKRPMVKGWQDSPISTEDVIRGMIKAYPNHNLGVVCGGGLVVMDFDIPRDYHLFRAKYDINTMVVKTGRGFHVVLRCEVEDVVGNNDFYLLGNTVKSGEFRAKGGYVVAPGSLHANGKTYNVVEGSVEEIARVKPEFIQQFLKQNAQGGVRGLNAGNEQKVGRREDEGLAIANPTSLSGIKPSRLGETTGASISPMEDLLQSDDAAGGYPVPEGYRVSWNEAMKLTAIMRLPNKNLSLEQKMRLMQNTQHRDTVVKARTANDDRSSMDMSAAHVAVMYGITEDEFIELALAYPKALGAKQLEKREAECDYLRHTYTKALVRHHHSPKSLGMIQPPMGSKDSSLIKKMEDNKSIEGVEDYTKNKTRVLNLLNKQQGMASIRDMSNGKCYRLKGHPVRRAEEIKNFIDCQVRDGVVEWDNGDCSHGQFKIVQKT